MRWGADNIHLVLTDDVVTAAAAAAGDGVKETVVARLWDEEGWGSSPLSDGESDTRVPSESLRSRVVVVIFLVIVVDVCSSTGTLVANATARGGRGSTPAATATVTATNAATAAAAAAATATATTTSADASSNSFSGRVHVDLDDVCAAFHATRTVAGSGWGSVFTAAAVTAAAAAVTAAVTTAVADVAAGTSSIPAESTGSVAVDPSGQRGLRSPRRCRFSRCRTFVALGTLKEIGLEFIMCQRRLYANQVLWGNGETL